jgi:ankyrin repeat protein
MVNIETEIISFLFYYLLFKASGQGHLEVVRLLINNERCNINEKNEGGETALYIGEY